MSIESQNIDTAQVALSVKQDFNINLTDIQRIVSGTKNVIFKSKSHDGKIIFVKYDLNENDFQKEMFIYNLFLGNRIPVPKVLGYKPDSSLNVPVLLLSSVDGHSFAELDKSDLKDNLYFELGKLLKIIHKIDMKGFGTLELKGETLAGKYFSWKSYWEETGRDKDAVEYLLSKKLMNKEDLLFLSQAQQKIINARFDPVFLHNDLNPTNIFTDKNIITGIIDFGNSLSGDLRLDIATALFFQNEKQQAQFKIGYGNLANDPLIKQYQIVVAARKIMYRHRMNFIDKIPQAVEKFREYTK